MKIERFLLKSRKFEKEMQIPGQLGVSIPQPVGNKPGFPFWQFRPNLRLLRITV
jgi:hypothetical protein